MTRKQELLQAVDNYLSLIPLIEDMVYLEEELENLRKLPKIRVNPRDKSQQKVTPAGRLYKDYLQQYTNIVKVLLKATGNEVTDEESPLRKWFNEHTNQE